MKLSILSLSLSLLLGCQQTHGVQVSPQRERDLPDQDHTSVPIYAASSLAPFLSTFLEQLSEDAPALQSHVNLIGSQRARLQLERGAPSGVFISASAKHIDHLDSLGLIEARSALVDNLLTIVSRSDEVIDLSTLGRSRRLVLADPLVPLGELTWAMIGNAERELMATNLGGRLRSRLISLELSARAVLGRLMRNEADSAILYQTDALQLLASNKGWRMIPLDHRLALRFKAHYHVALTRDNSGSIASSSAREWYRSILEPRSIQLLLKLGYQPVTSRP